MHFSLPIFLPLLALLSFAQAQEPSSTTTQTSTSTLTRTVTISQVVASVTSTFASGATTKATTTRSAKASATTTIPANFLGASSKGVQVNLGGAVVAVGGLVAVLL